MNAGQYSLCEDGTLKDKKTGEILKASLFHTKEIIPPFQDIILKVGSYKCKVILESSHIWNENFFLKNSTIDIEKTRKILIQEKSACRQISIERYKYFEKFLFSLKKNQCPHKRVYVRLSRQNNLLFHTKIDGKMYRLVFHIIKMRKKNLGFTFQIIIKSAYPLSSKKLSKDVRSNLLDFLEKM